MSTPEQRKRWAEAQRRRRAAEGKLVFAVRQEGQVGRLLLDQDLIDLVMSAIGAGELDFDKQLQVLAEAIEQSLRDRWLIVTDDYEDDGLRALIADYLRANKANQ